LCNHCCNLKAIVCVCILRYTGCSAHAPYCWLWPVRLYNIVCILRYTSCSAHAPYCRLWPVRLYNIVCILRYTSCSAHAPYCRLWPVRLYNIFPHYLIKVFFFAEKKITERKICALISSTTFIWNIYHSKKN